MSNTNKMARPIRVFFLLFTFHVSLFTTMGCADPFARGEDKDEVATNGTAPEPDGGGVDDKIEISFTKDVYPVLQSKCSACHSTGGPGTGSGKYVLTGTSAGDYEKIRALVDPGSPADSKLLVKGITMALTAGSAEYETIKAWITQGAAND